MTFRLEIRTENTAFEGELEKLETARILREVADRLEAGQDFETYRTLRDINGNDVGRAAFKTWNERTKTWERIPREGGKK